MEPNFCGSDENRKILFSVSWWQNRNRKQKQIFSIDPENVSGLFWTRIFPGNEFKNIVLFLSWQMRLYQRDGSLGTLEGMTWKKIFKGQGINFETCWQVSNGPPRARLLLLWSQKSKTWQFFSFLTAHYCLTCHLKSGSGASLWSKVQEKTPLDWNSFTLELDAVRCPGDPVEQGSL